MCLYVFVCVSMVTDLSLQVSCLVRRGPGQDPGVGEACPEQHAHDEDEEDAADRRDGRSQVGRQEGTAEDDEDKSGQSEGVGQSQEDTMTHRHITGFNL